jgi:2-dehydropantoate 2-reductase
LRILIIGAGAIGTMLGIKLHQSGLEVVFLDKPEVLQKLSSSAMVLSLKEGEKEYILEKPGTISINDLSTIEKPFDCAILCVKAYHTDDVCSYLEKSHFRVLLTVQNGVGNEEILAAKFDPTFIYSGAITLPVARHDFSNVEITNAKGGIALAPMKRGNPGDTLYRIFQDAGFTTMIHDDYREMKWSKLLLNILGNASSAILDMSPDEIFDDRRLTKIEKTAFMEGLKVMKALKLHLVDLPGYRIKLISALFWTLPPTLLEIVMSTQKKGARGSKMPSLHIDLASGSSSSEVEVLNGAIAQNAIKLGIPAPVNILFYEILTGMAAGHMSRENFRKKPDKLWETLKDMI